MKPPSPAPAYCVGLYPDMAEIARKHGYALAAHGSLARDFDLICIPWTASPSDPAEVVADICAHFAIKMREEPDVTHHGRIRCPLNISFGTCFVDLSFMPRIAE